MTTPLPPIYRDCRRLLVLTEDMVRRFSRYHKYTVGTRSALVSSVRSIRLVSALAQQVAWVRNQRPQAVCREQKG